MHIAIAPFFVGDAGAPRLVGPAAFPYTKDNRMTLRDIKKFGDTVALHYDLKR